ncbi:MAG: DNA recombination protein RmuC [Parachlamydia sp.]|nr:DNA recombination protein RmuC [Parachlamydia sp.]
MTLYIQAALALFLLLAIAFYKKKYKTLYNNWREEFERRLIAEEKNSRLSLLEQTIEENVQLKTLLAEKEACLKSQAAHMEEKLTLLADSQEKMAQSFKSLSVDALQSNTKTFLDLAALKFDQLHQKSHQELEHRQKSIGELVKPIHTCLQVMDQKLADLEKARLSAYTSLTEQVHFMSKSQAQLQLETSNLVKALRTPQTRGRWGEIQLKRVVEMAGMLEHCDFVQQETAMNEDRRFRPDMIIKLPNAKQVVVDSKAPLQSYLEALDHTDEAIKTAKMKDHARQIRTHISQLAAKNYWEQFKSVPEFVVLFLPAETFFSAALEHDPELIEWGVEQKVILATPTTLIALLKAVAYGWKQEAIAENAQKICGIGKILHERIAILASHFSDLRRGLERSIEAYNKSVGTLENRILPAARKFKDYGAAEIDIIELGLIDTIARDLKM